MKAVNRSKAPVDFDRRIQALIEDFTLLEEARWGWRKPL